MDKVASAFFMLTLAVGLQALLMQPWAWAALVVLVPLTAALWAIVLWQLMFS